MAEQENRVGPEIDLQQQLVAWAIGKLARQGLTVEGSPEVIKRRAWSVVLRIRSAGVYYYLKASPPALRYEAALTQMLARRYPQRTVEVLAADAPRGWLLMRDGSPLLREHFRFHADMALWHDVLADYARLQIAERDRLETYLDLGLPDRRPSRMTDALEALLEDRRLVPLDVVEEFSGRELSRLLTLIPSIAEICTRLDQSLPTAGLDHGDLHDGNIFYRDGCFRFFDWGDSSIGHPFVSLRTTFVSVENTFGLEEQDPLFDGLREAYLAPWRVIADDTHLQRTFELARRIWAVPSALRWAAALRAGPAEEFAKYAFAVPSLLAELLESFDEASEQDPF